jgi:hypothetical protein
MNKVNKRFKDEIGARAFRPMASAGVYDPMEQAGYRDAVPVSTVLKLLEGNVVVAKQDLEELLAIASSKEILNTEKVSRMEWGIKKLIPLTVRMLVERTIKENEPYYSAVQVVLLQLIPTALLDTELVDENLHEVGLKIDEIRFEKEDELAVMFQMVKATKKEMQELEKIINGTDKRPGELTPSQKDKIREIKFLNNVAQTIIHQ